MKKIGSLLCSVIVLGVGLTCMAEPEKSSCKTAVRIGVYDSRAIAVAFARSEKWNAILKEKMAQRQKAKAANDTAKVQELESWGKAQQRKAHLQGFGKAPVDNVMEYIKADLPAIAADANIGMIVSKWQIDFNNDSIILVDVTDAIVKKFNPSPKTLKIIEQLKTKPLISEEEILKHDAD